MPRPWQILETIPGPNAVPAIWKAGLGADFDVFREAFLRPLSKPAASYPCPHECGCAHEIVRHKDGSIVAVCQCETSQCPDIHLTKEDCIIFELNWQKLGRAISKAFGWKARDADLGIANTIQIAAYTEQAIPVILTIHTDRDSFRQAVSALAARLRGRFILFAPTADFMDATSQQILSGLDASFLPLKTTVSLNPNGELSKLKSAGKMLEPIAKQSTTTQAGPRYALIKGLGTWTLIFDGETAPLKHEKGIFYVAYLLQNPPKEPIHALDLALKIPEIYRKQLGITETINPITGKAVPLEKHARIQERSLGLEDMKSAKAVWQKQKKWEAVLEEVNVTEPERAEALRHLEEIAEFQRNHMPKNKSDSENLVRSVRRAITRFQEKLAASLDTHGKPDPVLRPFAEHLEKHLLIPSARFSGRYRSLARKGIAGCFTYEPPAGITWSD